jgi:hypothetical protein
VAQTDTRSGGDQRVPCSNHDRNAIASTASVSGDHHARRAA